MYEGSARGTREGVAAWQKMQECLRELAELNKEPEFCRVPARPMTMKSKCWLTMVCWALVCLVPAHSAGWHVHSSQVFRAQANGWIDAETRVWLAHCIG